MPSFMVEDPENFFLESEASFTKTSSGKMTTDDLWLYNF